MTIDRNQRAIAAAPAGTRIIHCPMRGPSDADTLDRADGRLLIFGDPTLSIDAAAPMRVPGLR